MIRSRTEALKILGLTPAATEQQWKSAYREICKKCHPDVIGDGNDKYIQYYYLATMARDYLENNKTDAVKAKVIGRPVTYKTRSYNPQKEREKRALEKQRQLEELEEKARQMRQKESADKEKEIADKIRWLRVTKIINDIMNT